MAATPGYHGYNQTLTTDDTFETIFDSRGTTPSRPVWGMEFWCSGDNAELVFNAIEQYGTSANQAATVVAGESPVRFYFDKIQTVKAKFGTVSGASLNWRTIGA